MIVYKYIFVFLFAFGTHDALLKPTSEESVLRAERL